MGDTDCVIRSNAAGKLLAAGRCRKTLESESLIPTPNAQDTSDKMRKNSQVRNYWERQSHHVYSLHVEKKNTFFIHVKTGEDSKKSQLLHLLLLENEHVCLVTTYNRYIESFSYRGKIFCCTCFSTFSTPAVADNHMSVQNNGADYISIVREQAFLYKLWKSVQPIAHLHLRLRGVHGINRRRG